MDPSISRLRKELLEISRDAATSGVRAEPVGGDMSHWTGTIAGPHGTPYEGGQFAVDITIGREYPFVPPKMKFTTRLWHPNVSSQTGAICLDILKNEWSPALTIKTALLSLCALLSCPEPNDPQDAEVAGQYKRDRRGWEAKAREWTELYAMPAGSSSSGSSASARTPSSSSSSSAGTGASPAPAPAPPAITIPPHLTSKVNSLCEMGFEPPRALRALQAQGGSLELAAEALLSGRC